MGHYIKRPEPGRFLRKEIIVEKVVEKTVEKPAQNAQPERKELDIKALANEIAQVINLQIAQQGSVVQQGGSVELKDTFDNSKTLSRLAEQMLVERGKGKANFDNLGNVKETKKDQKDVDNTIDLLSQLDN